MNHTEEFKKAKSLQLKLFWQNPIYRKMQVASHIGLVSPKKGRHGDTEYALDQKWISAVFERDSFTCRRCSRVFTHASSELHAHHIYRREDFHELRFEISNGIALCVKCHKIIDHVTKDLEIVIAFTETCITANMFITESNASEIMEMLSNMAEALRIERIRKRLLLRGNDVKFVSKLKSEVSLSKNTIPVFRER